MCEADPPDPADSCDADSTLARDSELSALLLQAAPDAIFVTDLAGTICMINRRAEELFGYSRKELIGQTIEILVPQRFQRQHVTHRAEWNKDPRVRPMGNGVPLVAVRRDGSEFPAEISLSPVRTGDSTRVISIVRDVTKQRTRAEELRYGSTHDDLTGLYNRAFFETAREQLQLGRRFPVSVLVTDIDGLKRVNDSDGHAAGDNLIRSMATVLKRSFRADEIVARIGGDEFAILLPQTDGTTLAVIIERVRLECRKWNTEQSARLEFSIGGATADCPETHLNDVVRAADVRMYEDKRDRRGD